MSWLWGAATNPQYEELVEKACSPLNLPYPQSENMADSLEVTDLIRSKAVQPKLAMQSLKRRIASPNGRVQMYALGLTDTCIKNGGDHFLAEIAGKEFVDEMSKLIKLPSANADVKQMALRLFQQWALAFQSKRELSFLVDVYNELKNSGTKFPAPPAETSSHLFSTITAPAWVDSDVCMRCRTTFTFTNRKHHCRNCGLVFDQACSSKSMELPHFGITTPVRVCDSCFAKGPKAKPSGPPPAVPGRTPRSRADYDADLQRAIELSLADSKSGMGANMMGSEPPISRVGRTTEDDDEELRLAIEASLREMESARPSAPNGYDEPEYKPLPTFDLHPRETETILTFSNTLDQMAAYGERDLRRFPHAHVLYEQAYAIGGKLHRNVEEKATKQQMLAEMQDKLSQAVSLYGQVLDGQQAYNARKLQEQQQRQYAQQYQQYQPPYGYDPRYAQTQASGYGYAPQPAQSPYAPQPAAPAGPSLYPSMPPAHAQAQIYPAQGYPATPYSPASHQPHPQAQPQLQPQIYAPQHASPYPPQSYTPHAPSRSGLERHSSLRSPPSRAEHPPVQRALSSSYPPQSQSQSQSQDQYASQSQVVYAEPSGMASAPAHGPTSPAATHTQSHAHAPSAPPVDMASHPSASPASSARGLPAQRSTSFSYAATSASPSRASAPQMPDSPSQQQQQQQQWDGQYHAPPSQHAQHAQTNGTAPPQQQQYPSSAPAQAPPQQVYYDSSFPSAPPAVFPDAPSAEPDAQSGLGLEYGQGQGQGHEQGKKEKEGHAPPAEAMLIEL